MAHQVEQVDINCINSDFDNKENAFNHNNALPCTEKGYEELDVSELNMKLRYSVTPTVSPMSKSFTNCTDNRGIDSDDPFNYTFNESNLTRSLNFTNNDSVTKSHKTLPLQSLSAAKTKSIMRHSQSETIDERQNITVTVSETSDIDDNLSLSSTTSSILNTPEATTPTKEIPKTDGGSPILRGLKSVFNMFRSSQSPITAAGENNIDNCKILAPAELVPANFTDNLNCKPQSMASTPIATPRIKDSNGSRRSSPYKDSIVFNDDLEKELLWKDETTIIFSHEKIPVHKLFLQQTKPMPKCEANQATRENENKIEKQSCVPVENMDISYKDCVAEDKTVTDLQEHIIKNENNIHNDSDNEFMDCETTFIKNETNPIESMGKELNSFNNLDSVLNSTTEPNKSFNHNQGPLRGDVQLPPLKFSENVKHDKSLYEMTDSLEDNANEKLSFKKPNDDSFLRGDELILHSHNTKTLENNSFSEYDLDSLEYNCTTNEKNVDGTNNKELATNSTAKPVTLQKDEKQDTICRKKLTLPVEIPLPDETDNDSELNLLQMKIVLADISLPYSHKTNSEGEETLLETKQKPDEFKDVINDNNINENVTSVKEQTNDELLIKCEKLNETYPNIAHQGEVCVSQTQNNDNLYTADETINTGFAQIVTECNSYLFSEDLDENKTAKSLEIPLSYLCNKNENSNSLNENSTTRNVYAIYKPDNVQQLNVIPPRTDINSAGNIDTVIVDQNLQNCSNINEINKTTDKVSILNDIEVNHSGLNIPHHITDNETELTLSNINEGHLLYNPALDTISDLEIKENFDIMLLNEDIHNSHLGYKKESIDKEESKGSCKTDKEMGLKKEPCLVSSDSENLGIILDSNNKHEQTNTIMSVNIDIENNDRDLICDNDPVRYSDILNQDKTEEIAIKSVDTNLINKHFEKPIMSIDEVVIEQNADSQQNINNPEHESVKTINNISMEQVSNAISNIKQLVNTNQIEIKDIKCAHTQEGLINTSLSPEVNLSASHVEIHETLDRDSTLKINIKEYNDSYIQDKVNYEKSTNIKESTTGKNMDIQDIIEISIDKNIPLDSNNLNNDVEIGDIYQFDLDKDDEIASTETNSPYVSIAEKLNKVSLKETLQSFVKTEDLNSTITISNSPPITSKGYNFNFDDMDDPFATNANYQASLTLQNINTKVRLTNNKDIQTSKKVLVNDIPKVQADRRKQFDANKNLFKTKTCSIDASVSETVNNMENLDYECLSKKYPIENHLKRDIESINNLNLDSNKVEELSTSKEFDKMDSSDNLNLSNHTIEMKMDEKCSNISNQITVSDLLHETTNKVSSIDLKKEVHLDKSFCYTIDSTSAENIQPKNVFNLPEIDDMNFNPLASKCKKIQSQPINSDEDNCFVTKSKCLFSPETTIISRKYIESKKNESIDKLYNKYFDDKMETEAMEKISLVGKSSDTCTSNSPDMDTIANENHTEDEDTIEGPFLEDLSSGESSSLDNENIDTTKFIGTPNQESEDNAERELFIDAEAFQFLLNQNKTNVVTDSGKESLFLKFDPLFAKRISSGSITTALSKIQGQSTPINSPKEENTPLAASSASTLNTTYDINILNSTEINTDNLNSIVSKPMMAVPPAVNAVVTQRKSQTPMRTNRHSGTFTSPAMAVIDRLLLLSANNSLLEHDATFTQVSCEQTEANLALTQLRELLAEKEIQVCNLRSESKDLRERLLVLETHMSTLERESQRRLNKIDELTETLSKRTDMDRNMAVVFEEYEATIANLINQIEKDKKQHAIERSALINERNEQTAHLTNMEVSFNDIHSKYEKMKQIIINYKANEESYKKNLLMFEENFAKAQNNYELLKQHATSKLNYANDELQKLNRAHETEVLKMNAMIKRKDMHITSIEETLAQKTKANEELTAICDELINKVG